jgi:hypothetical protein
MTKIRLLKTPSLSLWISKNEHVDGFKLYKNILPVLSNGLFSNFQRSSITEYD